MIWWDRPYEPIASVGLIEDPRAPKRQTFTTPWFPFIGQDHGPGWAWDGRHGYYFDPAKFKVWIDAGVPSEDPHYVPRENPASDTVITAILSNPKAFAPRNPYYQKNHVNAPGSVRSWFRQMRAADFERDRIGSAVGAGGTGLVPRWYDFEHGNAAWTLFDTQQVVDRETAAHYLKPDLGTIYFVQGGRVVGSIVNVWSGTVDYAKPGDPDYVRREYSGANLLQDITTCHERGGQPFWDNTDYNRDCVWHGLDRSTFPTLSAAVPPARGITLEDIATFVREDDARRSDRVRQAPAFKCPDCGGPVRMVQPPMGYVGPGKGRLLYEYAKLCSPDNRYSVKITDAEPIWMCDACRMAGVTIYRMESR